jgi:glycosyltransferase involved in cell wall biosynthesis
MASSEISRRGCRVQLTVLMPCLNEAETVATCVGNAVAFMADHGVDREVVVADNGSTDDSQRLDARGRGWSRLRSRVTALRCWAASGLPAASM